MIKNTMMLSKKDVIFISKAVHFNLRCILSGLVEVLLGIAILIEVLPLWKAIFVYKQIVGVQEMVLLFGFSAAGLFFIGYPIWWPYVDALRFYRHQIDKENFPEIVFGKDGVVVRKTVEGASAELCFEYSALDGYVEKNHVVYIRTTVQGSKQYHALHDDTYSEGSKAELLELLEQKNIRKLDNKKRNTKN